MIDLKSVRVGDKVMAMVEKKGELVDVEAVFKGMAFNDDTKKYDGAKMLPQGCRKERVVPFQFLFPVS